MTHLAFALALIGSSLCPSAGIVEGPDGRTIVLHTGSTNGFLAACTFPTDENDTTVILLTNVVGDGFAELRTAVFDIVWSTP